MEARAQFEKNVFGALWVTQAALPYLHEQRSGHIVQVSSIASITAPPFLGIYNASKWALEGYSEALAQEVAGFGIRVTLVEPGSFGTEWAQASAARSDSNPAYGELLEQMMQYQQNMPAPGDPKASAAAILQVVDAEEPPLRVYFGTGLVERVEKEYNDRIQNWKQWNHIATTAQG